MLTLAMCLLKDGRMFQVVEDIKKFSINEEVVVNKEHAATLVQNDPVQAFIYSNFRKSQNKAFPMFVHQLLALLVSYLRERAGSRMMVRDVEQFENSLRAPFNTRNLNCWRQLDQLVNDSKPQLDRVPGLYDLLTTIVKPSTSPLDYHPL